MTDRIIFLDIDGPMIPAVHFLTNCNASFDQDFDPRCVMVMKKIIGKVPDVKIVFNSTHNLHLYKTDYMPGLLNMWNRSFWNAADGNHLHDDNVTSYPNPSRYDLIPDGRTNSRRLCAIYDWLHGHYDIDMPDSVSWIAFDDVVIDDDRAFLIDFDDGIGMKAYDHAAQYLNFRGMMTF